jgi:hypothetical protein
VKGIINPDASASATAKDNHAERHILRELTQQHGVSLLAIGATLRICETCEGEIVAAGLQNTISVPTKSTKFLANPAG